MTTVLTTHIKNLLSFDFFVFALVAGIALAVSFGLLGTFVIIRKEANISHSIAHFALLGVTLSILLDWEMYPTIIGVALLGAALIALLKNTSKFSSVSINEIIAEGGLVAALIILGLSEGYRGNIMDFLFGDILTVTRTDMYSAVVLALLVIIFFGLFHKKLFQVSFHEELARSKGVNTKYINALYLVFLALAIAMSIKIIGVLLVTAFLVIPPNAAKSVARNYSQSILISLIVGVLSVIVGLFASYSLDLASGPVIVAVLILSLIVLQVAGSLRKR